MSLVDRLTRQIRWIWRSSMIRLALLLSVIFAVGMMVAIFVALVLGQREIEQRVDITLESLATTAVIADARSASAAMILLPLDGLDDLPASFQRVADRRGKSVELGRDFLGSDIWRILVTEDSAGTPMMIAVPLEESQETQELLAGILWTTTALVMTISLAIGLFTGVLAQRRLARIDGTLTRLATGDLAARTGTDSAKDDLDDIARQLDRTAVELESLVAQTRNLSASLAHDLRTPLARLRSRLEMLPDGAEREDALEEAGRLSEIFDTIMRVARIEAAQGQEGFVPVQLGDLITELEEIFGPVVEEEGKTLSLLMANPGHVQADKQMLVQAFANLIQNALVHGGDQITLIAGNRMIGIADNGAGVDPEQHDEIIKPMVRLDQARGTEGSGLGLALVRAVANRHGAKLVFGPQNDNSTAPGLKITLNFADL